MTSVGILEDNIVFRQTIGDFLNVSGKYQVVFSEGNFHNLAKRNFEIFPDVVLLDIHLSDVNGIDVISSIKKMFPDAYVIIITGDKDKTYVLEAIEKGACGYLYKPFSMKELENAISNVMETGSFLEPEVLTKLLGLINKRKTTNDIEEKIYLTAREKDILELLKKGHTYNEMADILCISFHTINHHIKNLYTKTNVKSKSELIVKFYRNDKI